MNAGMSHYGYGVLITVATAGLVGVPDQVSAQALPTQLTPDINQGIGTPVSLPGTSIELNSWQSEYILGPGDRIQITVLEAPDYSGDGLVLPDGSINLPRSGSLVVQGLTLAQAKQAIATHYSTFLRRPILEINLLSLRTIRVGISGEVNRPGAYVISNSEGQLPTLTDALNVAGGITGNADLRQIQVRRPLRGGQAQVTTINLWSLIQTGDLSQDLQLQGGDTIVVPTAQALSPQEIAQLGTVSFAPESIQVYVIGEVHSPGAITVQPNTPLNQVLLAAGGFRPERAETDEVRLIRLNPDGTALQRDVPIDFEQGIDEHTNPVLQANDVVIVRRSGFTNLVESVNPIVDFVLRMFSIIF